MNRTALAFVTALSIMSSGAVAIKALASGGQLSRPFEWTIEIDTQELPRQFQYHNSNLTQVVKAELNYYSMENQDSKTAYEDLWYSEAHSLGLERHHNLEIRQGDAIAIRVVHNPKNPSSAFPADEQRAAGKAVMKAIVDANINRNMVATIKVPQSAFNSISSEIQNYGFAPYSPSGGVETPINSDMNLFLESEPAGQTQTLVHYH
jgi:hypothetical protein